ncbi:adhesion G protein-coupled receptor E2-like [Strongylocentrotus purpuratus]|uniref:G-protein coupled receptors family 2 profile 2 domain-containing protein n=1 Tax=Strongylocentrotus purpuratus TaxID=7668 RepID=A0A7M7HHL0_STRPU|nr:adhesion G protein-coupled receptor E2-like [Strongylocentrotus purpuratus]|eukprot:XP_011669386.1 PREDICTED: EGF-like module-containing mucin-like hormone receptor-like 2 [Strongylocentrotus purpuratus]
MTLCGTLFLAQCLLMFGGMVSKVSRHLCTVFAVVSHFSWLMVFTVSTMIALDLSRTFGSHGTIRISTANRKLLVSYLSFATGVPFLIVGITLTLSSLLGEDIGLRYGDQSSCWVGDGRANLFVFGIPVLVLLCLNLFLFAKTIRGIARSKKIGMTLHEGKKVSSYAQELLKIAIKVSSIMGFTWLFGFVAAFSKQEALWFIFIILNAFQGVYIFLAFTATRRVSHMWRDLLLKKLYGRRSDVRSDMRLRAKSEPSSVQTLSV